MDSVIAESTLLFRTLGSEQITVKQNNCGGGDVTEILVALSEIRSAGRRRNRADSKLCYKIVT